MDRESSLAPLGFRSLLTLALVLGFFVPPLQAAIDTSINTTVWKMLYGVTDAQINDPAWLTADDDGDGIPNGVELLAGTNPFSAASKLVVTTTSITGSNVTLSVPTVAGKQYVVQTTADLANPAWTTLSPSVQVTGDGTVKALVAPRSGGTAFFRVVVQDIDTDGDGVSDWAEDVVGLDPTTAHTLGANADDHTTLLNDLAGENVITVTATKGTATQPASLTTSATDTGSITISRGGTLHFASLTVPLVWTGTAVAGTDYTAMPKSVTFAPKVGNVTLTLSPLANAALRTSALATASVPVGGTYKLGSNNSASIVIAPAGNPTGTGLTGYYFQSATNTAMTPYADSLFDPSKLKYSRLDAGINFTWTTTGPGTVNGAAMGATYYTVRWLGQVQPQYSETYYFDIKADDGVKLWVNGQLIIDTWSYLSADRLGAIALQAGVLYDIKLEYYQATAASTVSLSWYSNSQVKQLIPANRLYPDTTPDAPPTLISNTIATGFVGQPFNFTVAATATNNTPAGYAIAANGGSLPPGLTLAPASGLISGTPTTAGTYPLALTASNSFGTGGSTLTIQILPAGTGTTRELFNNDTATFTKIRTNVAPDTTDTLLSSLEDNKTYPDNTSERLRGYLTVPVSGNYHFWLAGNNVAELWVSDNAEPVNLTRRAVVVAPGTAAESWSGNSAQPMQRSGWLTLVAGQKYYYEVLHNVGTGATSQNVSVAWMLDSTGQAAAPATSGTTVGGGVTSGYVLSVYDYPTFTSDGSTLYVTNLSPVGSAASDATGTANIRLKPGNTQAILHFGYNGLSSPQTSYAVYGPGDNGTIALLYDINVIDKFRPDLKTSDGGYTWNIASTSAVSASTIVKDIQQGLAYMLVETVNYPNGEISGKFTRAIGSQTAPVAVADPGYADDSGTDAGAARFLNQAAFGAEPNDLAAVKANGYSAWIDSQMAIATGTLVPNVQYQIALTPSAFLNGGLVDNAWWHEAITGRDQLRQRVAFALSQILVVSDSNATIAGTPTGLASYYDLLANGAFGNFRDLLKNATLHPIMGYWLNMQGNRLGNLTTGYHPNENYAREIMQLFSIGLNRLWPDGTLALDSHGDVVPTYTQGVITNGFARVFTGWTWHQALQANGQLPTSFGPAVDWINPMTMVKNYHELGTKTLLDNVVLPAAVGYSMTAAAVAGSQADTTTTAYDSYCLADLDSAIDSIFYHPNIGPYICRQLIQRLVASNPTPGYVQRVVSVFNDDGTSSHGRGNMAAVIKAILLDGEARNLSVAVASTTSGKQREPILRITGPGRTFLAADNTGTFQESGALGMTITTANPHHFTRNDAVWLDFTGNSGESPATNPSTGSYTVQSIVSPTSFMVNATSLTSATYSQPANSNTLTVNTAGPAVGGEVYLKFVSATGGTEADGIYVVTTVPTSSTFTVQTPGTAPAAAVNGTVLIPKLSALDTITNPTGATTSTMTIATYTNANVNVGDRIWMVWPAGKQLTDSEWTVATLIDDRRFTVTTSKLYNPETSVGTITAYPLTVPPLTRTGNVALPGSKFDMGNTNSVIVQSPLDSPTVFNFYYPGYQYPGQLATANVTTPEFQLTTDSNVITLTNNVNSMVLSSGNTSGLSTFKTGAMNLDLNALMTAPYAQVSTSSTTSGTKVTSVTTTTVDANLLVNRLSDLLTGGTLTTQTKNTIVNFLNNTTYFPPTVTSTGTTTAPPAAPSLPTTSASDKARAAVQLILESPEYAVQQ